MCWQFFFFVNTQKYSVWYVHPKIRMRMFRTTICNSPKLQTIQRPIKSRIDTLYNIYTNGILYGNNKQNNIDEYHKNLK